MITSSMAVGAMLALLGMITLPACGGDSPQRMQDRPGAGTLNHHLSPEVQALGIQIPSLRLVACDRAQGNNPAVRPIVLYLSRTGNVYCRDPAGGPALKRWTLASDDVSQQAAALAALGAFVRRGSLALGASPALNSDRAPLVIYADKSATWKYAFWLLSLGFSPATGTGAAAFVVFDDAGAGSGSTGLFSLTWGLRQDPVYASGLEGASLSLGEDDWLLRVGAYRLG